MNQTAPENLFEQANREWDAGRPRKAFELFWEAAALGHPSAQNSLGYFYDHGISVKKNRDKAMSWYRKAARNGDVCACGNLAISYRDSGKVKEAKFWFAKALARGDSDAALELAKLYLGRSRAAQTRRLELAREYLRLAARSKDAFPDTREEARKLLEELTVPQRGRKRPR